MTDPNSMNIQEILRLLPHRYPFLMVDRVTEFVTGEYLKAYKCVSFNEPFFQGHFPELPVMPGVMIVEAMAQAGGLLVLQDLPVDTTSKIFLFTGIEAVKFRRPVTPGDRLDLDCRLLRHKLSLWKMQAHAYVDGVLAAEAVLTAAVMDKERMQ